MSATTINSYPMSEERAIVDAIIDTSPAAGRKMMYTSG
jgi:hypothetical protein